MNVHPGSGVELDRPQPHQYFRKAVETKVGNRVEDIGHAIQQYCESHGYGVVRELCGHGLGRKMHEDPEVPNYGKRGRGKKLVNGMVIAIEPMINMGTKNIKQHKDGWTITTADGKPSAHFEHDVAIIDGKPELLTRTMSACSSCRGLWHEVN